MPRVGAQEFPYTRDGIAKAKATAQATGQKVKSRRSYKDVAHAQSTRAKSKPFGGKQAPPFAKGQRGAPARAGALEPSDAAEGTLNGTPQRGERNSGTTFVPGERKPPPKAVKRVVKVRRKRVKT